MRKKIRLIVIDGHAFRWVANWSYRAGYRVVHLRVWAGAKNSGPLAINLVSQWPGFPTDSAYPLPREVRQVILYGLAHGWTPETSRAPFWLTEQIAAELLLDHLRVTDAGRALD